MRQNKQQDATTTLLRERELEVDQLKSELQSKQREDDRRFFVEEAIVFGEPLYAADGLRNRARNRFFLKNSHLCIHVCLCVIAF